MRCAKHKTCKYAPRCFHHTQVQVRPSQIAGRGLFAKEPIRKGAVVADYTHGTQALTQAEFLSKYPSGRATHVWRHPSGTYSTDRPSVGRSGFSTKLGNCSTDMFGTHPDQTCPSMEGAIFRIKRALAASAKILCRIYIVYSIIVTHSHIPYTIYGIRYITIYIYKKITPVIRCDQIWRG